MPKSLCAHTAAIDALYLLAPRLVPTEDNIASWIICNLRQDPANSPPQAATTNSELAIAIERCLSRIPRANVSVAVTHDQPEDAAHDDYFQVKRVNHESPAVFVRMVYAARLILLTEVDRAPSKYPDAPALIDRALGDLAFALATGPDAHARYVTIWEPAREARQAQRRWILGHHLFATLTQGLIFASQALARALRAGLSQEIRRWVDLASSLFRGSAAAMQFTGDFPVEEYQDVIRPSMMPPAAPICLSGLMSADHRLLVKTLHDMRPALQALWEQEPLRHEVLREELAAVYDQHIHVCQRFVGNEPSLLTAGRTEKSGPDLIRQFRTLRLKSFEHEQRRNGWLPIATGEPGSRCPVQKWSGERGMLRMAESKAESSR